MNSLELWLLNVFMYLLSKELFGIFELFFKMLLGLTMGEKLQVKEFFSKFCYLSPSISSICSYCLC
jgi:hypothetical protein